MSRLNVRTREKRFPAAPDLYGIFFEDISHAGDGGLYPEMLRNRAFEDGLCRCRFDPCRRFDAGM